MAGETVAEHAVCDFGDGVACNAFAEAGLSCAVFGLTANTTEMDCRALDGTVKEDPFDPTGYCLDNTNSGL